MPSDGQVSGYIGLCDGQGHNVSGGSVDAVPFVWKAVSSVAAPPQQQGHGQNTVLDIYQVRAGAEPQEWSGDQLTATSFYDNPSAPAAQATRADLTLRTIVSEFPPQQDGLYELRMYFGRVDHGVYSSTYPATFIQVSGDSWHVVGGGDVDCAKAPAVSNEVLTGVVTATQAKPPPPSATTTTVGASAGSGGLSSLAVTAWGLAGAAVLAAAGAAFAVTRSRRRTT